RISQFALLPQGQVEAADRVKNMVAQMDLEGFGNCSNTRACEVECPKEITLESIARMNREFVRANAKGSVLGFIFFKYTNTGQQKGLGFFLSTFLTASSLKL